MDRLDRLDKLDKLDRLDKLDNLDTGCWMLDYFTTENERDTFEFSHKAFIT